MTGSEDARHDHPGVAIRPPRLFLIALVSGISIDWFLNPWPDIDIDRMWRIGGGLVAAAVGILLASIAIRAFLRAGTNIPTTQASTSLVTTGLHGFSRNPIYIGMIILYLGLAVAAGSFTAIGLVIPVGLVLHFLVVRREEAYLTAKFGAQYLDYIARVPRWLGF